MKSSVCFVAAIVAISSLALENVAFTTSHVAPPALSSATLIRLARQEEPEPAKKGFFGGFFEELDAFVDDATSRRLGAGSAFYGKRKSNFYGATDKNRKQNRNTPDPTEDYQGPSSSGYFKWIQDDDGQMRPVTRMKEKVIERNPSFWDKVFSDEN